MRISRVGDVQTHGAKKTSKASGGGFTVESQNETAKPSSVATAGPLASVDALLALQADDQSGSKGAAERDTKRGLNLLKILDEVRMDLLTGAVPQSRLEALSRMLQQQRDSLNDPGLAEVLDEIDLRAQVELAKYQARS